MSDEMQGSEFISCSGAIVYSSTGEESENSKTKCKSICISSCTRLNETDFYKKSNLGRSLERLMLLYGDYGAEDASIDVNIAFENTKGMSYCYNQTLKYVRENNTNYDAVIFVHDDVIINDIFMVDKLFREFEKYDIVGVAGARKFSLTTMPVCWHAAPKETFTGFVCHPVNSDDTILQSNYFGPAPSAAAVLDGLFIAFNNKAIDSGLFFDEQFEFDFYDADICLSAQKKYGLKVGTSSILLTHHSHGEGIKSDRYRITQDKFVEKWRVKPQ